MSGYTSFQTYNGFAPKEKPKVLPVNLPFSASVTLVAVDLLEENTSGEFAFVQSMYIDNSDNASPLTVTIPVTGQRIRCPSGCQGTFPVYAIDQFQAQFSCSGQNAAKVHLCNFPQPYAVWNTI